MQQIQISCEDKMAFVTSIIYEERGVHTGITGP